ncbi:MAG: hypothetical protein KGN79_11885 [Acidobacteriota bacterium]|nr:hypothetical protein [Acidobacteriota bacterium]
MFRTTVLTFSLIGVAASVLAQTNNAQPITTLQDLQTSLADIKALLAAQAQELAAQRRQLEAQKAQISALRLQIDQQYTNLTSNADAGTVTAFSSDSIAVKDAIDLRTGVEALAASNVTTAVSPAAESVPGTAQQKPPARVVMSNESSDAPLSIRFGHGSLTPGGWVDFTSYYRSTNVGSGLGTAFASIPYSNTVGGGLSETRFTAQSSRISIRADELFGATRVFGYAEADFNGYLPANAYVSTNSDSLRLRVYFANLSRGRWEFLGGQSWSLLTPNRAGVSPFLSEIYNTQHLDTNYQVGLTYARQAQLRVVYHATPHLALGFSAENPEQYTGSAVTFPTLFNTSQADLGSSSGGATATPTLHPDLIAKLSADGHWGPRPLHAEVAGLLTPVAILTPASITGTTRTKDVREGSGISAAVNIALSQNLHFISTAFWSDGGGRYIGGLGPAFVVQQNGTVSSPFSVELLHSGSAIASVEWRVRPKTVFSLTYSGVYFDRVYAVDPSTGKFVGYGFPGSANTNNRALHEATFATQTTLWKHPGYGAVQIITQGSYIERTPWYVAPASPQSAHVFAGYTNLRYVLP